MQGDHLLIRTSWNGLLPDIGYIILGKLSEVVERIRFGAVCKRWCMISKEHLQLAKPNHKALPMLLVPSPDAPEKCASPRLYALSCCGNYYSNLHLQLPFNKERYCGSSYGWIAIQNEDCSITLIYPFGREVTTIELPAIKRLSRPSYCMDVNKIFISPDSTPDDYTVVAICDDTEELATIKSGEKYWVHIRRRPESAPASLYSDVIFYQGGVYAVSTYCMIVKVDIHARPAPSAKILHPLDRKTPFSRTYLVESTSSELYFLQRRHGYPQTDLPTVGLNVFKLKLHEEKAELIDQKGLNGDTFFVGDNTSIAVQAAHGCQPNSIYFTDDLHDPGYDKPSGPIDIGYYNVEDGSISHFYSVNPAHTKGVAPAVWIMPCQHVSC